MSRNWHLYIWCNLIVLHMRHVSMLLMIVSGPLVEPCVISTSMTHLGMGPSLRKHLSLIECCRSTTQWHWSILLGMSISPGLLARGYITGEVHGLQLSLHWV